MTASPLRAAIDAADPLAMLEALRANARRAGLIVDDPDPPAPANTRSAVGLATDAMTFHSQDPADIVAAGDEALYRVSRVVASMRASWMRDALCAEFDLDLWFPSKGQRATQALDICGRCQVRTACLDEALADEALDHGVRGGMTSSARQAARKSRRTDQLTTRTRHTPANEQREDANNANT